MASDPKTLAAVNCDDCGLVTVPATDPAQVLRRLPTGLFNVAAASEPTVPALLVEDVLYDATVFGPLGSDDATPQYEIARVLSQEIDRFRRGWQTAESLQLGLGDASVSDGRTVSPTPRASGADLDRVAEQYGIGRPPGFTDCCYWRLVVLLLFTPGPTVWRLCEIAALYTGLRPQPIEAPALLTLQWPELLPTHVPAGTTFFNTGGGYNSRAFFVGDQGAPSTAFDAFWREADAGEGDTFWQSSSADAAVGVGLTLAQALAIAKPAGVAIALVNPPRSGASGCLGVSARVPATGRGYWQRGTELGV